jgi:hypothetical protein
MNGNPYAMWLVAEMQHQERIKAAQKRHLLEELRRNQPPHPNIWQLLLWRTGDLLVALGTRLQPQANQLLHERSYRGKQPC